MWYMIACILALVVPLRIVSEPNKALVIVPVADLVGSPIKNFMPHLPAHQGYAQLPLCGGSVNRFDSCPRMHQALFNEVVEVIAERGDEVHIKIPNFFYITDTNSSPQHTYWTLKKNIVTFKELRAKKLDLKKIPTPIDFSHKQHVVSSAIVTLALPYSDPITQQTFSAGTRFVATHKKASKDVQESSVTVYAFHPESSEFKQITIPSDFLITQARTKQQQIKQFVQLIRRWAHQDDGFIPYVWGGNSFTKTSKGEYEEITTTFNTKSHSFFSLSDYQTHLKTGMDCSSLICLAAQICGIPYFYKNSRTVAAHLKPLHQQQKIEAGDIIWIPGHVMIVADTDKNTILEARSCIYDGQGKLQEITLDKTFKDISSYDELVNAFHTNKKLCRLGKNGQVVENISKFKLLKLASTWQ